MEIRLGTIEMTDKGQTVDFLDLISEKEFAEFQTNGTIIEELRINKNLLEVLCLNYKEFMDYVRKGPGEFVVSLHTLSYKQLLCESLNYCVEKKGLEIFSYVIMTSHLHMIARAKNSDLSKVMRDFKKFPSG